MPTVWIDGSGLPRPGDVAIIAPDEQLQLHGAMNPDSRSVAFHPLEAADRMHDGYLRPFSVSGVALILLQQGGVPAVMEGYCPHAGHPLAGARVVGADLRCDMHGYLFDVRSGACTYFTEGPCRGLRVYPCERRDGMIGVLL